MAFDLLGVGQSPSLYPLYSDIDSEIESVNNKDNDNNINLTVPASIRRQRYSNNKSSKLNKTYNYYRSMQNRNRGRGRNRIYRNNDNNHHNHSNNHRDNQYHNKRRRRNRNRHHQKSSSLSSLSIISSPRPNGCVPVSDQEFVYNLTQKIHNIPQEIPSLNGRRVKSNPTYPSHQNKRRTQKRRIRTFYSKKWGNRLYNLRKQDHNNSSNNNNNNHNKFNRNKIPQTLRSHSCDIPDMLRIDRYQQQHQQQRNRNSCGHIDNSQLQLWRNEVQDARRSLTAFIEEENLDLNDIKSVKSVSPSPSPSMSISASPMPMHLGVSDFRMDQDSQTVYYDSAASNIASNTDMESDGDDDDDEDRMEDIECTPSPSPNPNGHGVIIRDFTPTPAPNNMGNHAGYNNHRNNNDRSNVTISRYHEIHHQQHHHQQHQHQHCVDTDNEDEKPSSNFKIIVSAPNNEEIIHNTNYNHNNHHNHSQNTMNDRQNELMSRLKPKRSRRRYIPSVIESGASDDCSSCDDDDMTSTAGTGNENEMDNDRDRDDLYSKSLFLSENNLKRGVYASFGFSDTETDYLSAQSDDFDELTICYHHRNDRDRNNNNNNNNNNNHLNVNDGDKNIRFRNNQMMYLSDIGPSDIGSSDTECFSSNDSIPDSIPPPLHNDDDDIDDDIDDDFVSIN